jgi:hypothetical protein
LAGPQPSVSKNTRTYLIGLLAEKKLTPMTPDDSEPAR